MCKAYVFSDGFLSWALFVCAQGCPIGGKSLYNLSIRFVDTIAEHVPKVFRFNRYVGK